MPSVSSANGQEPLQFSPEAARTCHEIVDAITAVVIGAEAGLIWLHAQPPNLEAVQKSLHDVVNDGKRVGEMVVRLRALMNEGAHGEATRPARVL